MRCTFLLIVLGRTASTDYTATSFIFHTPEISIAQKQSRRAKKAEEKIPALTTNHLIQP